ncbi:hypothetical protein ACIQVK_10570 [Streptomyces sp. NPDC090493]|uniref:hypothetical protein n=1 Tax=Streptomyces sp. NPDC090493 TaxID=3365964 RepID=UPI003823DED3
MSGGGSFHIGDSVTQTGGIGNTGINKGQGAVDPQAAFRDMIQAIQVMRGQVSTEDQRVIDDSLRVVGSGANVEPGTLRRALGAIAGVATVVGEVGVPVVEAVRRVLALFGG